MDRFFPPLGNTFTKDILGFSDKELLGFYDNPNNFYIKDYWEIPYEGKKISNFIVSLTHGAYELPLEASKELIGYNDTKKNKQSLRLLKNFSDWGTTNIVDAMKLSEEQVVRTKYSRAIGDCNRDIDDTSENGFIRKTDFGGLKLFKDVEKFRKLGEKHYVDYHNDIEKRLLDIEKLGKKSFLFDIHDTGVRIMDLEKSKDKLRKELFPVISIADMNMTSCDEGFLEKLAENIEKNLGIKPILREPYIGGYVIDNHGTRIRKAGNGRRNAVMIEIGRFLYMKESVQEVNDLKVRMIGKGLKNAITDTVNFFS